jgi:UDP-N-acetylglucosamine:LPS N-acetylglucosamine transferase
MRFVGHLSDQVRAPQEKQYDITVILSGPEPQRTKLEKEILAQLITHPGKSVLVQGVMDDHPPVLAGDITIYPYRERSGINELLNRSDVIVCRTGYSSLMDLLNVGAKAILIPTPGQPEQEYLAERMQRYEQFIVQKQGEVNIQKGVDHLKNKTITRMTVGNDELLKNALMSLKGRIEGGGD